MRQSSVVPPITIPAMRASSPSGGPSTTPSTLPISRPARSTTCWSRMSRPISISAPQDFEGERDERDEAGDRAHSEHRHVAHPAVGVLVQVLGIVHQDQQRNDRDRKGQGGQRHGYDGELERIDAAEDDERRKGDDYGIDQSESGGLTRLQVLAPAPAEHLGDEIGELERDLQGGAEAGDEQRAHEEPEAVAGERRDQQERDLLEAVHLDA